MCIPLNISRFPSVHTCALMQVCAPRKYKGKKWDIVWYTTTKHCMLSIVHYAIENTGDGTINATYTQNVMGRPGVIPSRIQCNKTSGVT